MKSVNQGSRVKSAALVALVAVNALLVIVLISRHAPEAQAQAAGARVGDVLAVPAQLPGFSNGVVFLVDTTNQKLTAVSVDIANRNQQVQAMPPLDLGKLLNGAGGVRGK
jgi:hypothetical protein